MKPPANPKRALLAGAAWTVATRWGIRLIGLGNTLVMARLLTPADYGVVAMVMLAVGFTQTLLDFGSHVVLLRRGAVGRDEIDSAWTLQVLEGIVVSLLLVVLAWPAALFFKEPRVTGALWMMAGCLLVAHFGNIGVVLARKELNFSLDFRIQIIAKVVGVAATIAAGWLLRDYRALLIGIIASYMTGLTLSYLMHPYRPRLNLLHLGEFWHLSKWLMITSLGGFLLRKTDELAAARIGTTSQYGLYNMGTDLGHMPVGELGPALLRAFLPVLSTIQDDIDRTNAAVVKTLSAVSTLTIAVGAIFAALAVPATLLMLGPKWIDAAIFVAAFAIVSTLQTTYSPLNTLLVLRGHMRTQTVNMWTEFAIFVVISLALVPMVSLAGLAVARVIATVTNMALTFFSVRRHCQLPLRRSLPAIARPSLGAALAAALAHAAVMPFSTPLVQLAVGGTAAATFYILWSFLTWRLVGRPEGLESTLADQAAILKSRLRPSAMA